MAIFPTNTIHISLKLQLYRKYNTALRRSEVQRSLNLESILVFTLTSEMAPCCNHSPAYNDDDRQIQSKSNIQVQLCRQTTPNNTAFVCNAELQCCETDAIVSAKRKDARFTLGAEAWWHRMLKTGGYLQHPGRSSLGLRNFAID